MICSKWLKIVVRLLLTFKIDFKFLSSPRKEIRLLCYKRILIMKNWYTGSSCIFLYNRKMSLNVLYPRLTHPLMTHHLPLIFWFVHLLWGITMNLFTDPYFFHHCYRCVKLYINPTVQISNAIAQVIKLGLASCNNCCNHTGNYSSTGNHTSIIIHYK